MNLSETLNYSVTLPTRCGVKITCIDQIKLSDGLVLNNVLYRPDFRLNLLSVTQVTKDLGYSVSFDQDTCMLQYSTKRLALLRKTTEVQRRGLGLVRVSIYPTYM